jgi:tetratricopeptide (TPR) repeat protein/transcriptional regulator with XRE-family HTH domain
MPPEGRPGPFTELLAWTIAEQSLSLAQVAKRVDRQAEKDGVRLATTKQQVYRWRRGPQVPEPQMVRWLAAALDRPVEEFAVAAHRQRQLLRGRPEPSPGPAAPTGVVPAELPHDVADFTGRTGELAELRARLLESGGSAYGPVVTIDGPPGVGKSALAVHLAHQVRDRFPDAQLFANLRGQQGEGLDPMVVLQQFLRALDMASEEIPSTPDAAARAYRSRLADARALVVLDNALNEAQVRPLLPGSPTCAALITSRSPLSGLAEATALTLELLSPADAARVLARAAGNEEIENSNAAKAVAAQCGHLPLALRIAGARLRTRRAWTIETLASLLADERHRLERLATGDLAVRASFSLSYQGLDAGTARVFRLLGLLDLPELGTNVAAASTGLELPAAETALEQLTDGALLEAMAPGRYRFHDLVRLFARERAEDEEPVEARQGAVNAAVGWYLDRVLDAAALLGPAQTAGGARAFPDLSAALDWLESERENLVRVVALADAHDLIAPCWQLADALFRFYDLRRYLPDWQHVNRIALRAARRGGDRAVEGRMRNGIGYVLAEQSQHDEALEQLRAALAIRREVGDCAGEGRTLKNLGDVHIQLGQPAQALDCYLKAEVIAREVGDRHREGQAQHGLGVALTELGRLDEAEKRLDQALMVRREVNDQPGEGRTRFRLANVRHGQGRHSEAQDEYESSLAIVRAVGDRYHEGLVLWQMGVVAQRQGEHLMAQARWQEALEILDPMGCTEAIQLRRLLAGDHGGDQPPAAQMEICG